MNVIVEILANYWLYITIFGTALLLIAPWLFVWRYQQKRRWLRENGQIAQARIFNVWTSGLKIGGGSDERGMGLMLEVYPAGGQPYLVKTREQVHIFDLPKLTPGTMVEVRVDPRKPRNLVITSWFVAHDYSSKSSA